MHTRKFLFYLLLFWSSAAISQNVFFNEIDYLNPDLCVELAVPEDVELTGWSVTVYDDNGLAFDTVDLTGVLPTSTTGTGFSIVEIDIVMLVPTNGGMSLNNNSGSVEQFISYGGPLTAVDGPAAGQSAENIGTQTASGNAFQLQGVGSEYEDFEWGVPGATTCGFENNGQELTTPEAPLPVEIIYFNAEPQSNYVELSWATMTENNFDYFTIEKSGDGISFHALESIDGHIESNQTIEYRYTDFTPRYQTTYYRLKQVDIDGTTSFSKVIAIESEITETIKIYPNPVTQQLHIAIPDNADDTEIIIYDLFGKQVFYELKENLPAGVISLDLDSLPNGQYFIAINNGSPFYERIIKQN